MTTVKTNSFKDNKSDWILLISVWLFYVSMMVNKSIYTAEIIEIMNYFNVDKSTASYATTAYYFTYGFMQLVFAKLVSKINVRKYLTVMILLSGVCTFLVGSTTSLWQSCLLLGLNGIFHAGVWPGCLSVVSRYISPNMQTTANGVLSVGFAAGFILSYITSALFIQISTWKLTFWLFGILTIPATLFFERMYRKAEKSTVVSETQKSQKQTVNKEFEHLKHTLIQKLLRIFFLLACLLAFLANVVYYGISNWVPTLMYDVFNMPSSISTLLSVLVPIVGIFGPFIAIWLGKRHNVFKVCIIHTVIYSIFILALLFFYRINFLFSLVASVLSLMVIRGVTNTLGIALVLKARNIYNPAVFASIINAMASLGASVSPPVTGAILDNFGRPTYYIVLLVIAMIWLLLAVLCLKISRRLRVLRKTVLMLD